MTDLFKPTFIRMGTPINRARPPTSIRPPTSAGGSPTLTSVTTYEEANGTSTPPWTLPSSTQVGDGVVAFISLQDPTLVSVPSGWTPLGQSTTSEGATHYIYGKVITGSDSLNDTFETSGSGNNEIAATWVRIAANGATLNVANWLSDHSISNPPDPPSVAVPASGRYVCLAAALVNKGSPTPDEESALPTGYSLLSYHITADGGVTRPGIYVAGRTTDLTSAEDPESIDWTSTSGGRHFIGATVLIPADPADPDVAGFDHTHEIADIVDADTLETGDIFYSADGTNVTRLPIGTASQVLKVNSGATAPEWAAESGGGGGSAPEWVAYLAARQADETADSDDDFFTDGIKSGYTETTVTGTATWTEARGRLAVKALSGATGDASVALKAITASGPPLTVETAVMPDLTGSDFFLSGLCLTDGTTSTSNVVWLAFLARASGANNIQCSTGTLTSINNTNRVTYTNTAGNHRGLTYFRIVWTASNTFAVNFSTNGVVWHDFQVAPFSFTMTPTHFGPFVAQHNSTTIPLMASWEYLRMYEADLDV